MIQKLSIQNFQSHKDTELQFNSGVNVIVGSSDVGKTAILRALHWLVYNRPSGEAFRSNWGGDTVVEAEFKPGGSVVRLRSKKENKYVIENIDLKALKTDVPDLVIEKLQLSDVNLQKQMDSPFLLSNTAGQVADYLSEIAHLEQIGKTIRGLNSALYEVKQDIKFNKVQLEEYREKRKEFSFLDNMKKDVATLHKLFDKIQAKSLLEQQISSVIAEVDEIEVEIPSYEAKLELLSPVNNLLKQLQGYDIKLRNERQLSYIINEIEQLELGISKKSKKVKFGKEINDLLTRWETGVSKKEKYVELRKIVNEYTLTVATAKQQKENLKLLEVRFEKEMPDVCPLCGCQINQCEHSI